MILQKLYELAERERLLDDQDYEMRPVAWEVNIDANGRVLGDPVRTTGITLQKGNRKEFVLPKVMRIPRQRERSSNVEANYLVDNETYTLGTGGAHSRKAQEAFMVLVKDAFTKTNDEGLGALLRFLSDSQEQSKVRVFFEKGRKSNMQEGRLVFAYKGAYLHECPKAREFWKALRAQELGKCEKRQCLVTGKVDGIARLHPKLRKVKGADNNVPLISFNQPAFWSGGAEQGDNAPISRSASEACMDALNLLLDPPDGNWNRRFEISDNLVVLFWSDGSREFEDVFRSVFSPSPDDTFKFNLESLWRGKRPLGMETAPFYVLMLKGEAHRAAVQLWQEGTVGQISDNISQYFEDINLIGWDRYAKVKASLRNLLSSLWRKGKSESQEKYHSILIGSFFASVLRRSTFPRMVLSAAVRRMRALMCENPSKGKQFERDANIWAVVALIKCYLNRELRREQSFLRNRFPHLKEVTKAMDPNCTNVPVRLGKLFAVLERLQSEAQGKRDMSSNITQRYYGAASSTPAVVVGQLMKLHHHHLRKLKPALRGYYQKMIGQILKSDSGEPIDRFPSILTAEEQGLFAIGYYHQREEFWQKKDTRKDTETNGSESSEE